MINKKKYYYSFTLDLPLGGFPAEHPTDDTFIGGYYDVEEMKDMTNLILSHTRQLIKEVAIDVDASSKLIVSKFNTEDDALNYEKESYVEYEFDLAESK